MTRILVIHHDKTIRSHLETLGRLRYEVEVARNVVVGTKQMLKNRPAAIVVGQDKKEEGTRLLRYLRDNVIRLPVVVVFSRGAGTSQPLLMKLGAKAFLEHPVEQAQFDRAIARAIQSHQAARSAPPPITQEELDANLSVLEKRLNKTMKCFAGKNQVYLRSMILGGSTSKPRICLKCPLRAEYGLNREVYYEFIRDVCCADPQQCEAVRLFHETRESA